MEKRMRKWEQLYERLSNEGANAKLVLVAELESEYYEKNPNAKVDGARVTYDIEKKADMILDNLSKVENLLELREEFEAQVKEIQEELNNRNLLVKNEKLEQELVALDEEKTKLKNELKNPNLTQEEKDKLNKKLLENQAKIDSNNKQYSKNALAYEDNEKFADMSDKQLKDSVMSLKTKISIVNTVCNNLMKGYSWESIELKAANDDRFTANRENAEKIDNLAKANDQSNEKAQTANTDQKDDKESEKKDEKVSEGKTDESLGIKSETDKDHEDKKNLPAKISEFDKKHPRLARIKNWIKDKISFLLDDDELDKAEEDLSKEEEKEEDKGKSTGEEPAKKEVAKEESVKKQEEPENSVKTQREEFMSYLKDVAEKGLDGLEEESKMSARKQLLENKQNAQGEVDQQSYSKLEAQVKSDEDVR